MVRIAREHNVLVIEDDPYGELVFEGERLPSLFSLAQGENIVYLSTFSKTIAPGLRVAYAVGSEEIVGKLALAKQGTDLQTNTLGQYIVNEYLERGRHGEHIELIRRTYRERRDRMLLAMDKYLPAAVARNRPRGGMFLWVGLSRCYRLPGAARPLHRTQRRLCPGPGVLSRRLRRQHRAVQFFERLPG